MDTLIRDKLGNAFYGSDKSWNELEAIADKHFSPNHATRELDVANLKWFDYRRTHPVRLSYYFYHVFRKERDAAFRRHVNHLRDYPKARYESPDLFLRDKRVIGQFLSLRTLADEACVPYDYFVRYGFDTLMKDMNWPNWKHRGRKPPLPGPSFFIRAETIVGILSRWEDHTKESLVFSVDPFMHNQNYRELDIQKEHRKWLMDKAKLRKHPEYGLTRLIYVNEVLNISDVSEYMGLSMVKAIEESIPY